MKGVSNPESFMKQVFQLALENVQSNSGGPFAAIIVRDGSIIAEGVNRVTALNDPTAHAEIQAIRMACGKLQSFELRDCTIYVNCEPCPMCLGAILWSRIGNVYYGASMRDAALAGFDDQMIYDEISKDINDRNIRMKQLIPEEALKALKMWKISSTKINY